MASPLTLREKEALVAALLDAYAAQDLNGVLEQVHPDVEWIPPIALAEGRAFDGHAGVRDWWSDLVSTFEGFRAEVDASFEAGDRLVTLGRLVSRGRGSAIELREEVGWIWEFREGRISSMTVHVGHERALEAAGLR